MDENAVEKSLEVRGLYDPEGDGLYDRYLLALGLLIVVIIAFAFTSDGDIGRLVSVTVEGLAFLVILRSSRVHRNLLIPAAVLVAVAVGFCVVAVVFSDTLGRRGPIIVGGLMALIGPPVIIRRLLSHHRIDLTTVAGALCVYLLGGLFFGYLFWIVGEFDPPFFVQTAHPVPIDYIYFSFVTIATLGYGDYTPAGDLGKMLAVTEAISGQLYLVSAVALLVANLGRTRAEAAPPAANRPPPLRRRRQNP
jgi:Ion channel